LRSLPSLEKQLKRLRAQHTTLTEQQKWVEAQAVSRKTITLLDTIAVRFPEWRESCPAERAATIALLQP
jgi:hypothetical protein